ncbi:MAG: hypothetical protein EOO48_02745 [Flavobacterium sp.]|nr:MAG: hypothetical protein EOO48_02745 [Flavobacterium sp.]
MESDHKHYSKHGMREGDPGDINPNDVKHDNPANSLSESGHLDINQSESGHDDSYKASEEHINTGLSDFDNMNQTKASESDTEDLKGTNGGGDQSTGAD